MSGQTEVVSSRKLRIFLCHSSDDKPTVRNIYQQLTDYNVDPWLDEEKLLPGQDWDMEIQQAVQKSDAILICLTPDFVIKEGYGQKEIKLALNTALGKPEGTIFIIPLRLEECDVPLRLQRYQRVDYFAENSFDKLISALKKRSETLKDQIEPIGIQEQDIMQELRNNYFNYIHEKYEFLDFGGISPRVVPGTENQNVNIRMEDVFISLKASAGGSFQAMEQRAGGSLKTDEELDAEIDSEELGILEIKETRRVSSKPTGDKLVGLAEILKNRKVVILGHPGSGKTTIGQYIAYMIATQGTMSLIGEKLRDYIPIIVKAANYGSFLKRDNGLSLYRYVISKQYSDNWGPLFDWAFKNKKCLVIIDGLDEVPDVILRARVATQIEQFVSSYWENRFVITSRIVGYKRNQLTGNFAHFTLTELRKEQIIGYLEQLNLARRDKKSAAFKAECKQEANKLWRAIEEKEGIKKLAGTPLLLTIIALVNRYGRQLPERRVELYFLATETLLSNWPFKQRGQKFDWLEILSILEPIAYHMLTTSKENSQERLITEFDFKPLFEEQVSRVKGTDSVRMTKSVSNRLLEKIAEDTGFFLARGSDENGQELYGFLHPTFVEYLTARYLSNQWASNQKLEFEKDMHEDLWHEVILLMAGHIGTWTAVYATQFVGQIEKVESLYDKALHRNLLLVAEIIGDNVIIEREKREMFVSQLISIALSTPFESLWESILNRLDDIATTFPLLSKPEQLKFQEDDSINLRVRKVLLSKKLRKNPESELETLFQGVFADKETRELAMTALISYFDIFRDRITKSSITHALVFFEGFVIGQYGITRQVAEKISKLKLPILDLESIIGKNRVYEEDSLYVWLVDLEQLSKMEISKISSLITSLDNTEGQKTWINLNIFMQTINYGKFKALIFEECLKRITHKAFDYGDPIEVFKILQTLLAYSTNLKTYIAESKLTEMRENIKDLVYSDIDPQIRSEALRILNRLFEKARELDWKDIIMRGLDDSQKDVQLSAIWVVKVRSRTPTVVIGKLRELLTDTDPDICYASAQSIIRKGKFQEEEIPSLLEKISISTSTGQITTEHLYQKIVDLLILADRSNKPEVFTTIGNQLKDIIESDTYHDENFSSYRYMFGYYLRGTRHRWELIKVIKPLLSSDKLNIRMRAIILLSSFREDQSSPVSTSEASMLPLLQKTQSLVLPLLRDNEPEVRMTAIRALQTSDFIKPDIIDALIDALKDDNSQVKLAAMRAIQSWSNDFKPEVVEILLNVLREGNEEEADRAAWTLSQINRENSSTQQKVIHEVAQMLNDSINNKYAYRVLWKLLASAY